MHDWAGLAVEAGLTTYTYLFRHSYAICYMLSEQ
jgi:hypothetical protein